MWTVADVMASLPRPQGVSRLPAPPYAGASGERRVMLAVESMRLHGTSETYELQEGLAAAGYALYGHGYPHPRDLTDVPTILERERPDVVMVADKREWEGRTAGRSGDPRVRFGNVRALRDFPGVFRLSLVKDAHQDPEYHRQALDEIGAHAVICLYHPDIVCHLAPYLRREHLVRAYHTVDSAAVPPYTYEGRKPCVLSGAMNRRVYPLRWRLYRERGKVRGMDVLPHPGYHARGSNTPEYLKTLSRYKVSICTASVYGYALRKIVESAACGCAVITDLPADEVMPKIDGNLHRIRPHATTEEVACLVERLCREYDPDRQRWHAETAKAWYDWRVGGLRLARDIAFARIRYNAGRDSAP